MKLTVATSSLAAVLVATATATLTSMTVGVVSASSSSAVSATATTLSHRATAAKRSLLDINDPNDHELHAKSADDDELAAMTTAGDDAGQHRRRLEYSGPMVNVTADFVPLACNAALACDATGTTDLSVAMASPQDDGSVLLECGKCYRVDQTGDMSIPGGLNIE